MLLLVLVTQSTTAREIWAVGGHSTGAGQWGITVMLLHTGLAPANCEHHISTYLGQVSPGATCHVSGAHIAIIVITSSPHPSSYSALCPDANISSILRDSRQKTDCFLQWLITQPGWQHRSLSGQQCARLVPGPTFVLDWGLNCPSCRHSAGLVWWWPLALLWIAETSK